MSAKDVNQDVVELGRGSSDGGYDDNFGSSSYDRAQMQRMGKVQELKRIFKSTSLLSFTTVLMGTWQWMLLANTQGLTNGGRGGLFWSYIWTLVGYSFLAASLADMASMAPTAGGQYHWTSEFAPRKYQRVLSYASGWLTTLSWQAGNASGLFLCAYLVQVLAALRNPAYGAPAWQTWLITVALTAWVTIFNTWGERWLPLSQNCAVAVYVALLVATIVVLAAIGPHVDARTAIIELTDSGNWGNTGVSLMIGQISAVFALGGSDAAAHMSEECQGAGVSVPRAMFWTVLGNGLMGFVALIAFIFSIPSIAEALADPSGFPLVYALQQRLPNNSTLAFILVNLVVLMVSNIAYQASVSRQTFAFARDHGLPFPSWIGRVDRKLDLPVNAILTSATVTLILCAVGIGSSDAFNAILSLAAVGGMGTYGISCACVLWRRIVHPETLPKAQWSLGRWGIPVNAIGCSYAWFVLFWGFWPTAKPVTADSMNYAVLMFGAVVILSLIWFVLGGKKNYSGPVTRTEGYKET